MTKGELIEAVLLAVTGGKLSSESDVWREDIRVYLPSAVRDAVKAYIYETKAQDRADRMVNHGVDEGLLSTITRTPIKDAERGLWYIQLPKVMPLPHGWFLASAYPQKSGSAQYALVPSQASALGAEEFLGIYGWPEADSSRVYFSDMALPICPVIVRAAVDVEGLLDTDSSNVYSMVEARVIEICKAHFREQRGTPKDELLDNQDK